MITAVMQPYLFPYIGYYQLILVSDYFVFYDDVNYIKRGYVNRNNILLDGAAHRFTVPVPGASQNILISDLKFSADIEKIVATICHSYKKAPYFNEVMPLVKKVLNQEDRDITSVCMAGVQAVFDYLDIVGPSLLRSTDLKYDRDQSAADKLISITKELNCENYINSPGGRDLYDKTYFFEKNVKLNFIETEVKEYSQAGSSFISHLSIIDVLMWNAKGDVINLLNGYRLS